MQSRPTPSSANELEFGSGTVPEPLGPPVLDEPDVLLLDPFAASPVAEHPFGAPLDAANVRTQTSVAKRKLFESAVLMKLAVVMPAITTSNDSVPSKPPLLCAQPDVHWIPYIQEPVPS